MISHHFVSYHFIPWHSYCAMSHCWKETATIPPPPTINCSWNIIWISCAKGHTRWNSGGQENAHASPINFPQPSTGYSYTVLVAQGTHSVGLVSTFPHINLVLVLGYLRKFWYQSGSCIGYLLNTIHIRLESHSQFSKSQSWLQIAQCPQAQGVDKLFLWIVTSQGMSPPLPGLLHLGCNLLEWCNSL